MYIAEFLLAESHAKDKLRRHLKMELDGHVGHAFEPFNRSWLRRQSSKHPTMVILAVIKKLKTKCLQNKHFFWPE
jgi:hypothetical protein